jgi:hypothetical protein
MPSWGICGAKDESLLFSMLTWSALFSLIHAP